MEQKLMKVCTGCGEEKEATTEYFGKQKTGKFGFTSKCKKCRKKYREENKNKIKMHKRQYYLENKTMLSEKRKQRYRDKDKDKEIKNMKLWYKANKQKVAEYQKQYRKENKEKVRQCMKIYVSKNKEKVLERHRIWQKNNKDKMNIMGQKRKANKKQLPNSLTLSQWQTIKIIFKNRCAYCGKEKPLEQEHVIPLSKGGEYTVNNIIPCCKSCNSSKNNRDFIEWYRKQAFYSKEKEEFILNHLGYKNNNQQLRIV